MAKIQGFGDQAAQHYLYDFSKTVVAATPTLLLARSQARSHLILQNLSDTSPAWFEFDGPRGTPVITAGVLTSITITNAGFGFTYPPIVRVEGGGYEFGQKATNPKYLTLNQAGGSSPSKRATVHAILTGDHVTSFDINNGGANYKLPYIHMFNDDLDPYGCALPGVGIGLQLGPGEMRVWQGTAVPTGPVAVYAQDACNILCKWMS